MAYQVTIEGHGRGFSIKLGIGPVTSRTSSHVGCDGLVSLWFPIHMGRHFCFINNH